METPTICGICRNLISPEDILNEKVEKFAGGLVHDDCYWGQENSPLSESEDELSDLNPGIHGSEFHNER